MSTIVSTPANGAGEQQLQLSADHQQILKARGIPLELALAVGLRSVNMGERREMEREYKLKRLYPGLPGHPVDGILIPYPQCRDGIDRCRVRVDETSYVKPGPEPGSHIGEETVEIPRYLCQAGVPVVPYILPSVLKLAGDTTKDVYIVEAPLKALCLIGNKMPAIGLGGVLAGAHDKDALDTLDEIVAHDELKRIKWKNRTVYVVFDAGLAGGDDQEANPPVALGAARVQKALTQLGAVVKIVTIPYYHPEDSSPEDGKFWWGNDQGPDDFIVRNGIEAFKQLVSEAFLGDPKDRLRQRLGSATSKAERIETVADLLGEAYFAATLTTLSTVELKAVAAMTSVAGIGARDLQQASADFMARLARRRAAEEPSWTKKLVRTSGGTARPIVENVVTALRDDPKLAGLIAYDEFSQWVMFRKEPPWTDEFEGAKGTASNTPFTDIDDSRLALYLASEHKIHDLPPAKVRAALEVVARDHAVHPVREYLKSVTWDGTKRVGSWLTTYFGVASSTYASKVGQWWLISAVARIMKPGCKVDHTLILEGLQGLAKSSALDVLGGDAFSDGDLGDLRSKEAAMLLQGVWIQELPEGEIFGRATTRALKAFTTKRFDNIVPKFSNRRQKLQRQCVFALTTNDEADYLVDSTGNRRYWPVRCTAIDIKALEADRDQLWAEAVVLYVAGETWWPVTAEEKAFCKVEQQEREAHDTWEDLVRTGLREHERATIAFVLGSILNVTPKDQKHGERLRAGAALKAIGWVEGQRTNQARIWTRGPNAEPLRDPYPQLRLVTDLGMSVDEGSNDEFDAIAEAVGKV